MPDSGILRLVDRWLGVDVGGKRKGFDVAVVDDRSVLELKSRMDRRDVVELIERVRPAVVAIDSPCFCAPEGKTARDDERLLAKSICGIRWTPDVRTITADAYYAWIIEGLKLFDALADRHADVIEVFPTASWTRWYGRKGPGRSRSDWTKEGLAKLGLDGVRASNQDQRDAVAAAVTARQHSERRTETIGTIVVPAIGATPVSDGGAGVVVRSASQQDLPALLSLYVELAGKKTTAAPAGQTTAKAVLAKITKERSRELVVAVVEGEVVGTADLVIVPNLTHGGQPWAAVENVVVADAARRTGVGNALMTHLIERARLAGCYKLQLVSGKHRAEAHAFYRRMGLEAVAEGFKIYFDE